MEIKLLNEATAGEYGGLTFPAYRQALRCDPSRPQVVAYGGEERGKPAALALAAVDPERPFAQLLSVYVQRGLRGRGHATRLLQALERELVRRGVARVEATYMTGNDSVPALEVLFARCGWDPPAARMLVVRCSLDSIRRAPWIKPYPLPDGWSIVPWVDITEAQREEARRTQERAPWIPDDLVPFRHEAGLEPVTSLALCVNGKVSGWTINHVVEGVLRYTCSYVHRDLQRMGRVLLLYNEAVARMPSVGLSVGMWTVPLHHAAMARFARRWMQPYAIFFGETRGTGKALHAVEVEHVG